MDRVLLFEIGRQDSMFRNQKENKSESFKTFENNLWQNIEDQQIRNGKHARQKGVQVTIWNTHFFPWCL